MCKCNRTFLFLVNGVLGHANLREIAFIKHCMFLNVIRYSDNNAHPF